MCARAVARMHTKVLVFSSILNDLKLNKYIFSFLGLCDHASETLDAIREHSRSGHEILCQIT